MRDLIIDFRVRPPLDLQPESHRTAPKEYTEQYRAVFGPDFDVGKGKTTDDLVAEMDAAGVDFAVMHAEFEWGDAADALNEAVARTVHDRPDRFAGFGAITMEPLRPMHAVRQAIEVADLGLVGISHESSFHGFPIDDRRLYPLYARATELGLPVAVHAGINYTVHHPILNDHPLQIDQVACDFPDLTIIACHAGWPWIPEMVAVARKHPRVYMEFGGLAPKYVGLPGTGWEVMHRFMNSLLAGQVLHGTDWPTFAMARALDEWRAMDLKPEVLAALLGGNARRLLGDRLPAALRR